MWNVTWRNLVARKVRLLLSATAIVLGVGFVAGSFILTDTMKGAFDGIIKGTTSDVQIVPAGAGDWSATPDSRTIPASVVERLTRLPGAAAVHGDDMVAGVYVIGSDGKVVGGTGAPGLAFNHTSARAITGDPILTLAEGRLPDGTHEVAMVRATAGKAGYSIGDTVRLVTPGDPPTMTAELTGILDFGAGGSMAGATVTIFDEDAIQQLFFNGDDVYTGISMTAEDGVSQAELRDRAQRVLPDGIVAETGDRVAAESQEQISEVLGFITTFLLVFAGVALFVGTFLIINTFSILVAQRSRELALLRALGASRRQVNRSVMVEATAVGLAGSTLGIGLGYVLAIGLKAVFGTFGLDLSGATMPITARTVLVSYAAGLVVTLIAAYLPARRASRVAPVAAMRDDVALPESSLRRRTLVGTGVIALGTSAALVGGLAASGTTALLLVGLGATVVLGGVSATSAVIGRPLVRLIGVAYSHTYGAVGRLATQNSLRNPRRTAATASALMIGLALVAMMSILGQSTKASTDEAVESTLTADYIVSNAVGMPFSPAIANEVAEQSSVDSVARFRQAPAMIDGSQEFLGAADPARLATTMDVPMTAGTLSALTEGTILVNEQTASSRGLSLGDELSVELQAGTQRLTVAGVYGDSVPADYLVTLRDLADGGVKPLDTMVFISAAPDAPPDTVKDQVNAVTKDLPTVTVNSPSQFADAQSEQIDQMLYIIYALLGLAIIIAVLGIVNTLALSVIERTREVGLLRAIGVSRRQLRRMVRLESVIIALLGASLGVAMGIAFGIGVVQVLQDQGLTVLAIPWTRLLVFMLLAAAVGVLAAVLPARRAATLNVLRAITTE